ncbi:hypothetical protein ACO0LD_08760 [Undibacterium sp. Ji83W]|uniref:hypothetical protein n=1 Tax=Undibacterium sp. Ji83W TaxID=3413043 RepID=UPI003BF04462
MANKALATRQRMQFRVEPSQVPVKGRGSHARKVLPDYLTAKRNTKPLSLPATAAVKTASSEDEQQEN